MSDSSKQTRITKRLEWNKLVSWFQIFVLLLKLYQNKQIKCEIRLTLFSALPARPHDNEVIFSSTWLYMTFKFFERESNKYWWYFLTISDKFLPNLVTSHYLRYAPRIQGGANHMIWAQIDDFTKFRKNPTKLRNLGLPKRYTKY